MKLKFNFTYHPFLMFVAFLFILLPFSLYAEMNLHWTFIAYIDEALCVFSILYYLYYVFNNTKFKQIDVLIFVTVMIITIIGLISNISSKVITKWFPVIVDAICLLKMFLPFLVCMKIGRRDTKLLVFKYIEPIAKLTIILGAFFGTISQFVDLGMTKDKRYGISSFYFIFDNEGRYGYIIAILLAIVLIIEPDVRKRLIYNVLGILNMIYTTKGVVYIVIVCYIVLYIMWKNKNSSKALNIAILAIAGTAASTLQINTYLKDYNSPRVRLIRYGFITANNYFPLGSGFATYGSDMAMKNYSWLYDYYGFNNFYGLSREISNCLNDCYLGMVVGQFGYIGAVLYIILLIFCYIPIRGITFNNQIKALCYAIFIGIIISAIGTAIIKSSIGVMIFMFLGLVCGYSQQSKSLPIKLQEEKI